MFDYLYRKAKANPLWIAGFTLTTCWAVLAWFVYRIEAAVPGATILTYGDALWWALVTLLTVGYGDKVPITIEGKLLAALLMVTGIATVALLMARASSYFLERAIHERRGAVDSKYLQNHFVICGWKEEIHEILMHVLEFNQNLSGQQLVLIANISDSIVDEIKSYTPLKNVQIIRGEYYSESNLRRACPEEAQKVMILADRTPHSNGQIPTITEIDARTIMTAMTLSKIARTTPVAAEILESKMDQYLKIAGVSEIIYSREYSRLLLGNVAGGTGVANIVFDLLDPKNPTYLTTMPIPHSVVGQHYLQLKKTFESDTHVALIGVLENSGNQHSLKEQALRRAQKTTNVSELLKNLKSVKEMRCNHPVFNPEDSYMVQEGSMAIVIERRAKGGQVEQEPSGEMRQAA